FMDSVHHIWCPLFSQEFQDLPDGAETTLTLHEPGVAFTSTRAAREWLILNMAGLEREEFRVLYLNNQNQLIAG
ncbi:hypothetical protein F9Z55_25155, partial [Escherichia coli]